MLTCTFFGHADAQKKIEPILDLALRILIEIKNVNMFYVGTHGDFDTMSRNVLKNLKSDYPNINIFVVLAYMPNNKNDPDFFHSFDTIYPSGLEAVPPKYAISKRNEWMLNKSDFVITYVTRNFGGAAKFKTMAEKRGKTVFNLPNFM